MTIDDLISQQFPGAYKISVDGEDQWFGPNAAGIRGIENWAGMFDQMANASSNGQPGLDIPEARRMEILQQLAAASPNGTVNYDQMGQFLNPQENQALNSWVDYGQQQNSELSLGDYLARGAFGAGLAGMGALAFGGLGGFGYTDAASMGADGLTTTIGDLPAYGELGSGTYMAGENLANAVSTISPTGGALGSGLAGSAGYGSPLLGETAFGIAGNAASPWGANPSSPLGRILGGNGSSSDYLQTAGNLGGAVLGALGANSQAKDYLALSDKYAGMGEPFRKLLLDSYSTNFSMANQPDFQNAMDIGAQSAARATSAKVGNPVDNPGAYGEMQKYISGSLALPQLNTYRSQLGTFGQLGTNQAAMADSGAVQAKGGIFDALGYGLGQATQPDNPLKGLLSSLKLNINPSTSY